MRKMYAIAGTMLIAMLAACGGSDRNPTGPGSATFQATMSGDLEMTMTGMSTYGVNDTPQDPDVNFAIAMATNENQQEESDVIVLYRRQHGLPAVGPHAIVSGEDEVADAEFVGFMILNRGTDYMCDITAGTLNVAAASGGRVRGTFQLTAVCIDAIGETTKEVAVQGEYNAVGGFIPAT